MFAPTSGCPCSDITRPEITAPWLCATAGETPTSAAAIRRRTFVGRNSLFIRTSVGFTRYCGIQHCFAARLLDSFGMMAMTLLQAGSGNTLKPLLDRRRLIINRFNNGQKRAVSHARGNDG